MFQVKYRYNYKQINLRISIFAFVVNEILQLAKIQGLIVDSTDKVVSS